jgi:2-octaprenyl-6-methoxyphenol hydroxylase
VTKPNSNHNKFDYDVTIVGGGMVGMAAALALAKLELSVCILEHTEIKNNSHPSYDDRTLVVNRASVCFWQNLGIWDGLTEQLTPINKVHVSNKGHFGSVVFEAEQLGVDALAFIVEAKVLGMALREKIQHNSRTTIICPAQMTAFSVQLNGIEISYKAAGLENSIHSRLMLAADGAQSAIRTKLQLKTEIKSYDQTAVICNITPEYKHHNCAYERLTRTGPTAVLPFVNNRCGFVWACENSQLEQLMAYDDAQFLQAAQAQFGYRLGKFIKVGRRSSYPLYLVKVPIQVKTRTILMGNAAHAMSPVSAQGLNLAVRDVAMLVEIIENALENEIDIGADASLNHYQQNIQQDQQQTMRYTDDLMGWFKIDEPMLAGLRSAGLFAMDQLSAAKSELFSRASGYRGNTTPKLLRVQ